MCWQGFQKHLNIHFLQGFLLREAPPPFHSEPREVHESSLKATCQSLKGKESRNPDDGELCAAAFPKEKLLLVPG